MNYLGLDYGTKNIGVALATSPLSEPLTTLDTRGALQSIKQLVDKHHIDQIIVGLPDGPIKSETEKFVQDLRSNGYKLVVVDETLSSYDARQSLLHTTRTRRKQNEHSAAATIILQNFLDSQSQK